MDVESRADLLHETAEHHGRVGLSGRGVRRRGRYMAEVKDVVVSSA